MTGSWAEGSQTAGQFAVAIANGGGAVNAWKVTLTFDRAVTLRDNWNGQFSVSGNTLTITNKDEVGQMAGWFNAFIGKLHDIVRNIAEYFETVTASANQLLIISKQMDEGVHTLSNKSSAVARAAGEMSQNMHSVAAATEEAATNVQTVAAGTEEWMD